MSRGDFSAHGLAATSRRFYDSLSRLTIFVGSSSWRMRQIASQIRRRSSSNWYSICKTTVLREVKVSSFAEYRQRLQAISSLRQEARDWMRRKFCVCLDCLHYRGGRPRTVLSSALYRERMTPLLVHGPEVEVNRRVGRPWGRERFIAFLKEH